MTLLKTVAARSTVAGLMRRIGAFQRLNRRNTGRAPDGVKGAEWYDQAYEKTENYHEHYTRSTYYFLWTVLADRLVRSKVRRVLDLGCGPGQFASLLFDKGLSQYRGVDFSSRCIAMAKRRCPYFEFTQADLMECEILSYDPYDCLVTLEFLEHIESDVELIKRVRPGTKVFATVPNFPYISHVRHFSDHAQVRLRYEPYFSDFSVDAFLENEAGKTFYLIEGTKGL